MTSDARKRKEEQAVTAPTGVPVISPSIYGNEIAKLRKEVDELEHKLKVQAAMTNLVLEVAKDKSEGDFGRIENLEAELQHWKLRAEAAERQVDELLGQRALENGEDPGAWSAIGVYE